MSAADTVTIPREEYESLVADSEWRTALEAEGVDNWHGYDYAMEALAEIRGETE